MIEDVYDDRGRLIALMHPLGGGGWCFAYAKGAVYCPTRQDALDAAERVRAAVRAGTVVLHDMRTMADDPKNLPTMTAAETARLRRALRRALRSMSEAPIALSVAIELELSGTGGDVADAYHRLGEAWSKYIIARCAGTPEQRELERFEAMLRAQTREEDR